MCRNTSSYVVKEGHRHSRRHQRALASAVRDLLIFLPRNVWNAGSDILLLAAHSSPGPALASSSKVKGEKKDNPPTTKGAFQVRFEGRKTRRILFLARLVQG